MSDTFSRDIVNNCTMKNWTITELVWDMKSWWRNNTQSSGSFSSSWSSCTSNHFKSVALEDKVLFNISSTLSETMRAASPVRLDQCEMCRSLRISVVIFIVCFVAVSTHIPGNGYRPHKTEQRERNLTVPTLNQILMDVFSSFFFAFVSLIDHKIRDFIARQLVSAQRWGGCSVFTVRDVASGSAVSPK